MLCKCRMAYLGKQWKFYNALAFLRLKVDGSDSRIRKFPTAHMVQTHFLLKNLRVSVIYLIILTNIFVMEHHCKTKSERNSCILLNFPQSDATGTLISMGSNKNRSPPRSPETYLVACKKLLMVFVKTGSEVKLQNSEFLSRK